MAVLHVNLVDGTTRTYDTSNGGQQTLSDDLKSEGFHSLITSVSINSCGSIHSLPKPRCFGEGVHLVYERIASSGRIKGADRVSWFAGDVRLTMVVHDENGACRTLLTRIGRRIFGPPE